MSKLYPLLVALAFLLLLTSQTSSWAANETCQSPPPSFVGDHRFAPSTFILTPFATPSVTTVMLFGIMHPPAPPLVENLDIVGFAPTLEAQLPIIKRLTLSVRGTGLAIAGVNAISALSFGATTGYRIQVGALYQFVESPRAALSFGLTVGKPHLYTVSPLISIRERLNNYFQGATTDLNFVTQATQWIPSLRAAYNVNPTFGIQGSLGAQIYSADESQENASRSQFMLVLGFDTQLKPQLKVPLAFDLIYSRNQVLTKSGAANTNTFGVSIFETFSDRFNFGTELGWITTQDNTVFALNLMTRYYY